MLFWGVYVVFLAALCVGGFRLYWKVKFGVPVTTSATVWDFYFPEIRTAGVLEADIHSGDQYIDVLMLGASTIEANWGNIEKLLYETLRTEFGDKVRVFNLAVVAHTSRDSALKATYLADKAFDVVLVYDGINDSRMNNCPDEFFRADYTHCTRYRSFEKRKTSASLILPPDLQQSVYETIGLGVPDPPFLQFGAKLKTPGPFRSNFQTILAAARRHKSLVVLNTFATHIPDDYSDEKLKSGKLDFAYKAGASRCPLHMWGQQDHVVAAVRAHNAVISELAAHDPDGVVFVDQQALLSGDGKNFIDVCHFSDAGCERFVANLMNELIPRLRTRFGSRPLN